MAPRCAKDLVADPYDTLHVRPDASDALIRQAYRFWSQVLHPDHDGEGFLRVGLAYEVLHDPVSRAEWDAFRASSEYASWSATHRVGADHRDERGWTVPPENDGPPAMPTLVAADWLRVHGRGVLLIVEMVVGCWAVGAWVTNPHASMGSQLFAIILGAVLAAGVVWLEVWRRDPEFCCQWGLVVDRVEPALSVVERVARGWLQSRDARAGDARSDEPSGQDSGEFGRVPWFTLPVVTVGVPFLLGLARFFFRALRVTVRVAFALVMAFLRMFW